MTDRLYYTDSHLRAFDAVVRGVDRGDDRLVLTLDRTAFYPTSGGQPFDTGTFGEWRVADVVDREDGTIAHHLDVRVSGSDPLSGSDHVAIYDRGPTPGQTLHGEIDWPRRFDHMQQHTGQHVLSAAFERVYGARTVSFHLGTEVSTIDLARELTPAEIGAAEAEANRIVWEDRAVAIRFATAEEAATLPLRKEPARGGTLRLIDVEGYDLSACGGTHVTRTGAIGVIAVASWERFKGGQRLEFLCGGRALGRFRSMRDTLAASVRLLSVQAEDLPASIDRLQSDSKEQKRSLIAMQNDLACYRAEELAAGAVAIAVGRLVLRAVDADANGLKTLASAITAQPGFVVVLSSTSRPALVVVARSAGVPVAAQHVLSALTGAFGGRGGGKPEMAQGGGLDAAPEAILEAARVQIVGD